MNKQTIIIDWRTAPEVIEARTAFEAAQVKAQTLENEITQTLTEIRAIEAERASLEAEIINGKAAPSQLIDRKVNQASKRAHLETLEDQAASIYKGLAAARDRLNDAEAKAKAVAWQAGMQEYVQAADELGKALETAVEAEQKVVGIHRMLGEVFGVADHFILGPERVGSAAFGHRRLTPEGLANWKAHRTEAGIIPDSQKKKRRAEELFAETKRIAMRQSREEARQKEAEEYWRKNAPQSTRDLSPGGLVRVTMFPGSGEGGAVR